MKYLNLKRLSKGLAPPILMLLWSLFGVGTAHAITNAGTTITNTASVVYEDAGGIEFTADSEPATVDVGAIYGATIASDNLTVVAVPSSTEIISFSLINTANTSDTFTLTFGDDDSEETGTGIDAVSYQLQIDGTPYNSGDTINLGGVNSGSNTASINLLVQIPGSAAENNTLGSILTVESANTIVQDITSPAGGADAATRIADLTIDGLANPGVPVNSASGDESVQSLITITEGADITLTKTEDLDLTDPANPRITYTLLVQNSGGVTATDVTFTDTVPVNTTFDEVEEVNMSASNDRFFSNVADGFVVLTTGQDNGGVFPYTDGGTQFLFDEDGAGGADTTMVPQSIDEADAGIDLNGNASAADVIDAIQYRIASLPVGQQVSVVYSVTINSGVAAATNITNTFCVYGNYDGLAGFEAPSCSGTTFTPVPAVYDVEFDDTDGNADGDTDGADVGPETETAGTVGDDEDNIDNDTQHEASATGGETVRFNNFIQNNGNATDTFTLSIDPATNTFPDGTNFAFYNGNTQLTGSSITLGQGGSATITVRATLPSALFAGMATEGTSGVTVSFDEDQNVYYIESGTDSPGVNACSTDTNGDGCYNGAFGANGTFEEAPDGGLPGGDDERFSVVVTATSQGNASISNTKRESLGSISFSAVDLANSSVTVDVLVDADGLDLSDGQLDYLTGNPGTDAANMGPDAISVGSAGGDDDIANSQTVSPGTTVVFPLYIRNEAGATASFQLSVEDGDNCATTGVTCIPDGWTVDFYSGAVSGAALVGDSTTALGAGSEFVARAEITIPADGALAPAGTYDFVFRAESNADSSVFDLKADRVVVTAICAIVVSTDGVGQVQPSGTVVYTHTIDNNGNEDQLIDLTSSILATVGSVGLWTVEIFVDTDNNGDADTEYDQLVIDTDMLVGEGGSDDQISIRDITDTEVLVFMQDKGGVPAFLLQPGEGVSFEVRVFADPNANVGDVTVATIGVNAPCAGTVDIDNTSTVALQVVVTKQVAVDTTCACDGAGLTFEDTASGDVLPGQCVVWRMTVVNQGTDPAQAVRVEDAFNTVSIPVSAAGPWGAANPAGVADPGTYNPYWVCVSDDVAGGDCSLATPVLTNATSVNTLDALDPGFPNDEDVVEIDGTDITFYLGEGATGDGASTFAGGVLDGSDRAIAQFCEMVQ